MRNPWARELYKGPWADNDPRWTAEIKKQVPYINANDGSFFMSPEDFIKGFRYFTVTYYVDGNTVSYYEKKDFTVGQTYSYTFDVTKSQQLFAGADVYVERMYPGSCRGQVAGTIRLLKNGQRVGQTTVSAGLGFGYIETNVTPGKYELQVSI